MQVSKIAKQLIKMFFTNLNSVFMWEYLGYKNVYKIKALVIKLLYDKVTW